jgi:hypothetical protein
MGSLLCIDNSPHAISQYPDYAMHYLHFYTHFQIYDIRISHRQARIKPPPILISPTTTTNFSTLDQEKVVRFFPSHMSTLKYIFVKSSFFPLSKKCHSLGWMITRGKIQLPK